MDKISQSQYNKLSDKGKIDYLTEILGLENGTIYGKVAESTFMNISIELYGVEGRNTNIFKGVNTVWEIPFSPRDNVFKKGDYVRGQLILDPQKGPDIVNIEKMESYEDFRNKLTDLLKEKWKKQGFQFSPGDIEWVDEKTAISASCATKFEVFIQDKMKKEEKKLKELQKKADAKQSEIGRLKASQKKERAALLRLKIQRKAVETEYRKCVALGIISEEKNLKKNRKDYVYRTYKELIKDVWAYLWRKKNLFYEEATVRYFMNALRTQQLIVLWGRPGTGKTSLPRAVAEALGAECIRIQVQSNWTDNEDLLGFYNIADKRYFSTQFLDALLDARKNPGQLYLILLDEMNLSNVEYYFSEMLNVFTWDEAYTLHLYSQKLLEDANQDIENRKKLGKDTFEDIAILKDLVNYPYEFTIPENVRFVGTLNTDETTKTISPKVIDRSCLIELQAISRGTKEQEEKALPKEIALDGVSVMVGADWFEVRRLQGDSPVKDFVEDVRNINKLSVSNRIDSYIEQWVGWEEDHCVECDEIMLEKILPMIDMRDNTENRNAIKSLKDNIFVKYECEKSKRKLERMEEQVKENHGMIRYWEK